MARKKRCTFMIDPDLLDRLRSVKVRTGLSEAEQIRQGIRWWLQSREWPPTARGEEIGAGRVVPASSSGTPRHPPGRRSRRRT